jgi:hypothetical protein
MRIESNRLHRSVLIQRNSGDFPATAAALAERTGRFREAGLYPAKGSTR